jgi:S-adenosylmethionine:tRNA ribosyltransferase-isomerase
MTLVLDKPRFVLPEALSAGEPPEARGVARDGVRLLVAEPGRLHHTRFRSLPGFLRPGDLVVVNRSATLPAAVDGVRADGSPVVVHFSTRHDDGTWTVELRRPDASGPILDGTPGEAVIGPAGSTVRLLATGTHHRRLWRAEVAGTADVPALLARHGRPIGYGYLRGRWPIEDYQPVFAREPGSAEMASAGRPFTDRLVTDLVTSGVAVAPVTLHTGVSSLEAGESPQAEPYRVPAATARLVNATRQAGGRIVAVGTTVTRALESAARPDGTVLASAGWTELLLGPDRPARVVTGLITGWHAPDASHLLLLEAVAGPDLVRQAYDAALAAGYRWHEFGDSCLLLPAGT